MNYFLAKKLKLGFSDALFRVEEELKKEGFGIVTRIDLAKTFESKLNKRVRPYTILGACNPSISFEAVTSESGLGVLLPCNFVVREDEDDSVQVLAVDPVVAMEFVQNDSIRKIASRVREIFIKVIERL